MRQHGVLKDIYSFAQPPRWAWVETVDTLSVAQAGQKRERISTALFLLFAAADSLSDATSARMTSPPLKAARLNSAA